MEKRTISETMLDGFKRTNGQHTGEMFDRSLPDSMAIKACGLGCVWLGLHPEFDRFTDAFPTDEDVDIELLRVYPELESNRVTCDTSVSASGLITLWDFIQRLNDKFYWAVESIAFKLKEKGY